MTTAEAPRRTLAPRWLRSARWRPAAFVAILLLSTGAVLVSALTPMLIGALSAATLRDTAAAAPMPQSGFAVGAVAPDADAVTDAQNAASYVLTAITGTSDRWGPDRMVLEAAFTPAIAWSGSDSLLRARLTVAEDGCEGLRLTGRCPTSALEALAPSSLVRSTGWRVGTVLSTLVPDGPTIEIRVVGVFDDSAGTGRILADPTVLQTTTVPRAVPNLVVGPERLTVLRSGFQVTGGVRLARPLRPTDLPALRAAQEAAQRAVADESGSAYVAGVRTELPALLRSIAEQQTAVGVLATPVGLEALVLAWFGLGAVAQRTARGRAAEWGVGRMRGARPRRWFGSVFVEPVVAILAGAAIGFPLAVLLSRGVAGALFGAVDDVDPLSGTVLAAAGLAVAGSVVAIAAASVRAASLPLPDLLQDTAEPRQLSRVALVGQVVIVSLAAAVIWSAITAASLDGDQLGLLLPAMLALLTGIVAVRLAVVVVRRTSRRAPRSLPALVVGRGLARAPSALVAAQLVLVASALAAGGLQLGLASAALQTDRATLATGASTVLTVRVPIGTSLVDAVRRADPDGRTAMAAAELTTVASGAGRVTAVDTTRVDAVSAWRTQWRSGVDLARLRPRIGQDLVLTGTRLTARISDALSLGDPELTSPVSLSVLLARQDGWRTVDLGRVRSGTTTVAIPCSGGCRVVSLSLAPTNSFEWGESFTIASLSTDQQPASALQDWLAPSRWRDRVVDRVQSDQPTQIDVAGKDGGLQVTGSDGFGGQTASLEPANGPAAIPVVAGSATPLIAATGVRGAVTGSSLDDTVLLMHPVGRAVAIPRSLRDGVLVDLAQIERAADPTLIVAAQQVWLAPGDHPAVLAALRAEGIQVLATRTAATAITRGLDAATNRALLVAGIAAAVGLGFGLLSLVATRVVDMPARRREWSTLRLSGVGRRALRRLALVQMAGPSLLGAVLGVVAGSVAATLIVGRLPLLVGQAAGPPLDVTPPFLPLVVLAAGIVVLVVLVAVVTTALETRRSRA